MMKIALLNFSNLVSSFLVDLLNTSRNSFYTSILCLFFIEDRQDFIPPFCTLLAKFVFSKLFFIYSVIYESKIVSYQSIQYIAF